MNTQDLISITIDVVKDSSFSRSDILRYINEGMNRVASLAYIPTLVVPEKVRVRADSETASLPDDFIQGRLYSAILPDATFGSVGLSIVQELSTFLRIKQKTANFAGCEITRVCPNGCTLWVDPCQSTEANIDIVYQRYPEILMDGEEFEPDCFPDHLHEQLLVNYAAHRVYDLIEDGVGDRKDNTKHYLGLFSAAVSELKGINGIGIDLPDLIPEEE